MENFLIFPSGNICNFFIIWSIKLLITCHVLRTPGTAHILMCCYVKKLLKVGDFQLLCNYWFHRALLGLLSIPLSGTIPLSSTHLGVHASQLQRANGGHRGASIATLLPLATAFGVKTTNRRKERILCRRERERNEAQVRTLGAKITCRDAQSQTPAKHRGTGMQPNNGVGPLGRNNWNPPSSEEEVIGKGGRKRQQMGGGGGVEEQKCN